MALLLTLNHAACNFAFHQVKSNADAGPLVMTKQIRALSRGLEVVQAIHDAGTPLSLGELHRATDIDRATLLRILATLAQAGWVYRGMGDRCYRLTYKLHDMGIGVSVHDAIAEVAAPVLDRLQCDLHWPSDVGVYHRGGMTIIETSRRRSVLVVNREVVGYRPGMLKSAMGRAYLAYCEPRRLESILAGLRQQGGEDAVLAADGDYVTRTLSEVRRRGFAVRDPSIATAAEDVDDEFRAIAVPIVVLGEVQATLNLVWLATAQWAPETEVQYAQRLKPAAEELAQLFYEHQLY